MHWAEASSLELLDLKNFKFFPLKLDLRKSGSVLLVLVSWFFWFFGISGFLVLLVFWYQSKLGFDFSKALPTEKVRSSCQKIH
jgi:hypothetical protein